MRHRLLLLLLMLVPCAMMMAQEAVTIHGRVTVYNKVTKENVKTNILFSEVRTKEVALEAKEEFDKLTKGSSETIEKQVDQFKKKYKILKKNKVLKSGRFEIESITTFYHIFLLEEYNVIELLEVKPGKTEYEFKVEINDIGGPIVKGKRQDSDTDDGAENEDTGDGFVTFNISIRISDAFSKEDARLIVQTYAVNCHTEDTAAYCPPIVYEGNRYHGLQDKRMNFDYEQFDSLSIGYKADKPIRKGEEIIVKEKIRFEKPDKRATYRSPFTYVLRDYHREYLKGYNGGTCLSKQPFKFLDYSPAVAEMDLSEDFREEAGINRTNEKRELPIRFVVGKAEIDTVSSNQAILNEMISMLNQYGDLLTNLSIHASASPDGNYETNKSLALRRAQTAASVVQRGLSRRRGVSATSDVKTWDEVVQKLRDKGKNTLADSVADVVSKNKLPNNELKTFPNYDTDILPILERMRAMEVSFQVFIEKVYTPNEALEEFRLHRLERINGKKKPFTNGDYWNIFSVLTDSAEIDTLTVMAYNHIIKNPDYAIDNVMAPYVCNRMAIVNIQRGTPDTKILEPFVDLNVSSVPFRRDGILMNRKEIMINQAISYYQDFKNKEARKIINILKKNKVSDPALDALERIINLRTLHKKDHRTDEEQQAYTAVKEYVLSVSDENKAILYTEIPEWDVKDEAMHYIDLMSDDMPKKWYLKGLWWAIRAANGTEEPCKESGRDELENEDADDGGPKIDLGDGFYLLSENAEYDFQEKDMNKYNSYLIKKQKYKDEHDGVLPEIVEKKIIKQPDDDVEYDHIPYYLAYFNHAFELDKEFKRIYFNEGHVPDEIRKKFKFKNKDVPGYRKLFKLLYAYDKRKIENSSTTNETNSADTVAE